MAWVDVRRHFTLAAGFDPCLLDGAVGLAESLEPVALVALAVVDAIVAGVAALVAVLVAVLGAVVATAGRGVPLAHCRCTHCAHVLLRPAGRLCSGGMSGPPKAEPVHVPCVRSGVGRNRHGCAQEEPHDVGYAFRAWVPVLTLTYLS